MPVKDMPKFIREHKEARMAVYCSLACALLLFIQFLLMTRNVLTVAFDVVIPFTAVITFGCYAITMAYDRPQLLICPPMAYFISLLINQLFSVEVKVSETYPIFTLLELIPVVFYCFSCLTLKLKKYTTIVLKIWVALIILTVAVILVLAFVFKKSLYTNMSHNFSQCAGMLSIMSIYIGMIQQLKIAGTQPIMCR